MSYTGRISVNVLSVCRVVIQVESLSTFCLCVELFDMKTRYEESDNIVVRATRTVTDKMSELFGTFMT